MFVTKSSGFSVKNFKRFFGIGMGGVDIFRFNV